MTKFYNLAIILVGVGFGLVHRWHVSTLFENDRYFSHLSDMEREMSFRTEMGMYYYYFKILAEADTFSHGWKKLTHDNISEHGVIVNACSKYSLVPEVIAGFLYHIGKHIGLSSLKECWKVERGDGLPPVESCHGLGVPIYFYLEMVWYTTIVTGAMLFYYSTYLSGSMWSGLVTILLFFYNHNECTRVQWTPPLRESFIYPVILCQMYIITRILRQYSRANLDTSVFLRPEFLLVTSCSIFSLCTWQFAQFVFTTQLFALMILKWFKIIHYPLYLQLYLVHFRSMVVTTYIMDTNSLMASIYTCVLFVASVFVYFERLRYMDTRLQCPLEIAMMIFITVFVKGNDLAPKDDLHVYNILLSKLTDYKDFHSMLYTCSPEFDFMQYKTYEVIIKTLLLPVAILAGILVLYYWYRNFKVSSFTKCIEPEVAYNGLQTGAYILMAIFIMRLKLFMNPQLCIIAGLVCAKRYLEKVGIKSGLTRGAIVIVLIACMSPYGYQRFQEERSIIGEYRNVEQEQLFEWVKSHTWEKSVFAGKMSLMANLMLSTNRPVVNNPYYESTVMRNKTMLVYQIFSRKDIGAVYSTLRSLKVDFVILEKPICLGYANLPPGCQMLDIWDVVDHGTAKALGKPPVCPLLFQGNSYPFRKAFSNDHYVVLQLDYSYSLEYERKDVPRLRY